MPVYCYATIVSHALSATYPSAGAFLRKTADTKVRELGDLLELGANTSLPIAGWHELVRELAIQQALGRL